MTGKRVKESSIIYMKVLFSDIGIPAYTHPLLEKIVSKGCDLTMLIPEKSNLAGEGVKFTEEKEASYNVQYYKLKKMWYGKSAISGLKEILNKEKPDILILIWPFFLNMFFDRSIFKTLKKNNTKFVIREIPFQTPPFGDLKYFKEHPVFDEDMNLQSKGISFKIRSFLTMYIRKYVYKRTDAYISYFSGAKNILTTYGLHEQSVFYGNTSDTDSLFAQRNKISLAPRLLTDKPRVLHIGRLVKWKRVDLLIEAFGKIAEIHSDSELIIIGNGPEKVALEGLTKKLRLDNRIIFTGAIYDPYKLGQYMYESSAYVLAGMGGLSINDAMSFSLPVICSVCDGTETDLVTDGVNGYFFEEGNVNSLSDKIDIIFSDPDNAKKMGEASFSIIKNKVNLDTVSQIFIDAFEYVINKKRS